MFNLGVRQTPPLVDRVPYIRMLRENNARKGFFEHDEFLALRNALPAYLKGVVTFAYKVGWRHSEITGPTWKQVDRQLGIVRLEVGETKNSEGRTVYLDEELKAVFEQQWERRKQAKKTPALGVPEPLGHRPAEGLPQGVEKGLPGGRDWVKDFSRFQAHRGPQHGPRGGARARGDDGVRPQDPLGLRPRQHRQRL